MMGNMSVLLSLLFSALLLKTIRAASSSHLHFDPRWELGFFLAGIAVNIIYYSRRIFAVTGSAAASVL
jgi:hypothetical protein